MIASNAVHLSAPTPLRQLITPLRKRTSSLANKEKAVPGQDSTHASADSHYQAYLKRQAGGRKLRLDALPLGPARSGVMGASQVCGEPHWKSRRHAGKRYCLLAGLSKGSSRLIRAPPGCHLVHPHISSPQDDLCLSSFRQRRKPQPAHLSAARLPSSTPPRKISACALYTVPMACKECI